MSTTFLDCDEVIELTGRIIKSKQIEALRKMGLPFFVNATGRPIVARCVIEGRMGAAMPAPKAKWVPDVLRGR